MRELEDSRRCNNPETWLSRFLTGKGQRSSLRAHYKHRECNVNPRPQLLDLLLTGSIASCHCSCLIHEGRDQGWGTSLILEVEKTPQFREVWGRVASLLCGLSKHTQRPPYMVKCTHMGRDAEKVQMIQEWINPDEKVFKRLKAEWKFSLEFKQSRVRWLRGEQSQ